MHITDPIADLLTRIRNAKHQTPFCGHPCFQLEKAIANILVEEGYIKGRSGQER